MMSKKRIKMQDWDQD